MPKRVDTIVVGSFEVNCYLVTDEATGDLVIIDPGDEAEAIVRKIETIGGKPKGILLTHAHGDHIAAVTPIRRKYNIPLIAGVEEKAYLSNPALNLSGEIGMPISLDPADRLMADDDLVSVGSISFRVLSTPGHTAGGVCYLDESDGVLFCGDTLFAGSIGRTDFPGGSHTTLIKSIQQKILTLPDSIVCHPGHGPKTTVGVERRSNPFLLEHIYG